MKKIILLVIISAFPFLVSAQEINASEIINKAFAGEDLSYSNVTIKGTVDLTPYMEKKDDSPSKSWWGSGSNTIEKTVTGKIIFENCVFEEDVLAYLHDDKTEYTFITHFENDVVFKNCQFKKQAAFKYSDFEAKLDFSGSILGGDANFKYAEFDEVANFSKVIFEELANFKYAEFNKMANFASATFNSEANFKYAELENDVSFNASMFNGLLNLKYAELDGQVNLKGIQINGDLDTKYTEVQGQEFSKYLLSHR